MIGAAIRPYIIGAALVSAVALVGAIYALGGAHEAVGAAKAAYSTLFKSQKEWNNAANDAQNLDGFNACLAVGRVPNNCDELLRDNTAAEGE